MKYVKLFENFIENFEKSISFDEVRDIFLPVADHGLSVNDCFVGNFSPMDGKKIIDNPNDFNNKKSFKGLCVRLSNKNFNFTDDFFDDLQSSIEHFESRCVCKLNSLFVRVTGGQWFSDVDTLREYTKENKINTSFILFIDIVFSLDKPVDN